MTARALVAGAGGLIGRRIAAHLLERGWDVAGIARRRHSAPPLSWIAADLTDTNETRAALATLKDVTHVFFAARADHPEGVPESESRNTAMLRNLLDALSLAGSPLARVTLVHGTKHYGHPDPIPFPVSEELPRGARPTFYFAQEDLVRSRATEGGWTWSIARPHTFCDPAPDHPRSIALVMAIYATIQRALGEPLFFPGSERSFNARTQFTDTALLARALEWMATEPRCANQAFNIVNGDVPRWCEMWPRFADMLGIEPGGPRAMSLARYMCDKEGVWQALVERNGLRAAPLERIVLWDYGDYVFRPEWDIMSAMNKARRYGFEPRVDTLEMFSRVFAGYREARVIP